MPGFPGCALFASGLGSAFISGRSTAGRLRPAARPIAEVYPALWSRNFAPEGRTGDQHDAYSIRGLAFARRTGW